MKRETHFPFIENHGVLLNNRTAALISNQGSVDFACFPNFDSFPTFASILDYKRGGHFTIYPEINDFKSDQEYEPDTNILRTNFYSSGSRVLTILDFLPMTNHTSVYFSEIHRRIESFDDVTVLVTFAPFLSEKRKAFKEYKKKGYMVQSDTASEYVATDVTLYKNGNRFQGKFEMKVGEHKWLVSAYNLDRAYPLYAFDSEKRLWSTRNFWKEWIMKSKYQGIYYENVNRSLLLMKGLFFEPSGFMVAAPTTSLPESIGGDRNWDYRYMWIRDTSLVIEAMARVGYVDEAMKFYLSIIDRYEKDGKLFSVYPINDGDPVQETETDLSGYMNSRPVRFGNAAHGQLQIDQYASLIHGLRILLENGGYLSIHVLEKILSVGDALIQIWDETDSSIWEIRDTKRNYVYSRAMAWRALRDLSWLSSLLGMTEISKKFELESLKVKKDINSRGISKDGFYVQSYGSDDLDASLLRLALIGYTDFNDKYYVKTFDMIERNLMPEEFLFKRYTLDDGMKGNDNAFVMLSFWYIRNLIIKGELEKASRGLIKILKLTNSLGLLPEEIEFRTKRYLGNYPQALSHLSFILAILEYDNAIHLNNGK